MRLTAKNRVIVAIVAVVALAVAFWMLVLTPKRDESKKLGAEVKSLESSLAQHQAEVAEGEDARTEFSSNYRQLVVMGKAVPGDDDTASLLVQVNRIAGASLVSFNALTLNSSGGEAPPPAPAPASEGGETVTITPTEAIASTMPLGAEIGPAGLAVMPYTLEFEGDFFEIADFIKGLDSLVKTSREEVTVDGRLLTIDGFSLEADPQRQFPALQATFSVTTYLTPPGEGIAGGATPEGVGAGEAAPVSTTTGGGVAR
jgi:Tfp pilus assembly protein PilO